MNKLYLLLALILSLNINAQERLFFIGYTKNYFSKDSTNVTFNFDLNRIPGSSEKIAGTYLYNGTLKNDKFGLYLKPTADINIGSGTTTAPNNINVGLPLGFAYDGIPYSEVIFEIGPEMVADKNFDNYLFYGSAGLFLRYEYKNDILFNLSTGANISHGTRTYSDEIQKANGYSRFTIPTYVKFCFWNASKDDEHYYKVHLTNTFKFNNVFEDNNVITPDPHMIFNTTKLDLYIIPQLAISAQYQYGYEEPLFKKIKSLSLGISFAKF
ncbi:hypothetical protein AAEO57_10205 [Flavobacterium sp. DGU38]|uniref:Outer membrane protein beta-barrel domain-containing protein n=1 Tax=Flavobacterium calami TaxID=3139144 RepID=A0ABU9INX6_9FLAO